MNEHGETVGAADHCNDVRLVGRLSGDAVERTLPSGDPLVTWRLVIRRPQAPRAGPPVDTIDCMAWAAGIRRKAMGWSAGDVIECEGSLRRRFWRTAGAAVSRFEVEVTRATRMKPTRGQSS